MLVRKPLCLFRRVGQHALALLAQGQVHRGRDSLPNRRSRLDLLADRLNRGVGRAQEAVGERFVFTEQAEQLVLRFYGGASKLAGFVAAKENHPTRLLRIPFEHGPSVMPSPRRQYSIDTPLTVVD